MCAFIQKMTVQNVYCRVDIVFAMRNDSTMVNNKNNSDIVLLFYIAMHIMDIVYC